MLDALATLPSPSRATLELIYSEGYSMGEVADISGVDEAAVEKWRITSLTELADELGVDDPETAGKMLERALGDGQPDPVEPVTAPQAAKGDAEPRPGSARRIVAAAIVALAVVTVFVIVAPGGNEGSETPPSASAPPTPSDTPAEPETEAVRLEPLPGTPDQGSITVAPRDPRSTQIDLELKGLPEPDGRYEAWLYSSVLNSESLGSIDTGTGTIEGTLPPDAGDYEFLDVSIQPKREGPHSGRSVLRVPLEEILGR